MEEPNRRVRGFFLQIRGADFLSRRPVGIKTLPMTPLVARFIKDESGTTAIEYALVAVGISVAILATVQLIGANVLAVYDTVAAAVAGAL